MARNERNPVRIEIRIEGHLDPHWATWFGDLTLTQEPDGTTTLRGPVTDQTQLHGIFAQIRDLGATLISLTPLDPACAEPHTTTTDHPEGNPR